MNDGDRQFADAARVIAESLALRSVQAACTALEDAAADSRAADGLRRTAAIFRLAPTPIRVRNVAILVATACLTHLLLTRWLPRRLAPAVPAAWWIAAGLAAAAVAAAAGPFTTAWRHRRP